MQVESVNRAPNPDEMVSRFMKILYMAGEITSPPMTELIRIGPKIPIWSTDRLPFILGWTTLSQNPLTNPANAPMAMHAPILLMVPATTPIAAPPLSTPINDSLTPIFHFPKIRLLMYVQMTLAVSAKQMLRGPSSLLYILLGADIGYKMPVKGKQAKINPVPIRPIKAEWRDPVGDTFPGLQFIIAEVIRAKNPAKTQTQLVPQSSQREGLEVECLTWIY